MPQPAHGLGAALLPAQNEGEEEGGLGLVASVGLGDGQLGHVLVIAGPRGQRHQCRRQPVARSLDHEFFADLVGGGVRDVADVEGLEQADARAAHHLVVAVVAFEIGLEGAELGLGPLHGGDPSGLPDVVHELPVELCELLLRRPDLVGDLQDLGVDAADLLLRSYDLL